VRQRTEWRICDTDGSLPRALFIVEGGDRGAQILDELARGERIELYLIQKAGQGEFQHRGPLHSADGPPITIDGLWAIAFGSGAAANGPTNTLFFTAGPDGEQHGLFGTLVVAP